MKPHSGIFDPKKNFSGTGARNESGPLRHPGDARRAQALRAMEDARQASIAFSILFFSSRRSNDFTT